MPVAGTGDSPRLFRDTHCDDGEGIRVGGPSDDDVLLGSITITTASLLSSPRFQSAVARENFYGQPPLSLPDRVAVVRRRRPGTAPRPAHRLGSRTTANEQQAAIVELGGELVAVAS